MKIHLKNPVEKLLKTCGKAVDEKSLLKVSLKFAQSLVKTLLKLCPNLKPSLIKTDLSVCINNNGLD